MTIKKIIAMCDPFVVNGQICRKGNSHWKLGADVKRMWVQASLLPGMNTL